MMSVISVSIFDDGEKKRKEKKKEENLDEDKIKWTVDLERQRKNGLNVLKRV